MCTNLGQSGTGLSERKFDVVVPTDAVMELFADIWCPFTHVGLRAVDEQRRLTGRSDVAIRVRAWPLELVNGAPLDPTATRAHVDNLREQVAPTMFMNFRVDQFPSSTLEALALVERAYRTDVYLGERTSFALRDALFEAGQDVSDERVMRDIARRLGVEMPEDVDRQAVLVDWREGQKRGVRGSPHFFCGETNSFCPSLQITKEPGHSVSIHRDASRLTAFLKQCLSPSPAEAVSDRLANRDVPS